MVLRTEACTQNSRVDSYNFMKEMISKLFNRSEKGENTGDTGHLTRLLRRYAVEQQHVPKDLLALVALKYLPAVPVAPEGRRFVIDRRRVEVRLE